MAPIRRRRKIILRNICGDRGTAEAPRGKRKSEPSPRSALRAKLGGASGPGKRQSAVSLRSWGSAHGPGLLRRFAPRNDAWARGATRRFARPRNYTVAWLPRITVDWDDSTPPLPWAMATSQSLTWRTPHSPRNYRTASIKINRPYMPGWQ